MKQIAASGVWTPYFNRWNEDAYRRGEPFSEEPLEVLSSSTSGACVMEYEQGLCGITRLCPSRFSWDKRKITFEGNPDVFFHAEGDLDAAWESYHKTLGIPSLKPRYGKIPEYCTWVEQVWLARHSGRKPFEELDTEFVLHYLDRVADEGWPSGRFTVDEGWCLRHGPGGFGDWLPHDHFDPAGVAGRIQTAGHVPGLWLAAALISQTSTLARSHPGLVGERFEMDAESGWAGFAFLNPGDEALIYLTSLFRKVWEWGFRKVKLDIFYGRKTLMVELLRLCREAAASVSTDLELEGHVPDPFASRYVHVLRTNDVLISSRNKMWKNVVDAHFLVCRRSSPHHLLNLDHLGGNSPDVSEAQWLEHAGRLRAQMPWGYPVVSLLPHHIGPAAVEATANLLTHR